MKLGRNDYLGHRQAQILAILEKKGPLITPEIVKVVFSDKGELEYVANKTLISLSALERRGLVSRTEVPVKLKRPRCGSKRSRPRKMVNQWRRTEKPNRCAFRKEKVVLP